MGYTTTFDGKVAIDPPLNQEEIQFLTDFSESRRMDRKEGPYELENENVLNHNKPPEGQPSLWCDWVPTPDGEAIVWDGREKFYDPIEWMQYLIDHFLKPNAIAKDALPFLQANHTLNGEIFAQGESHGDIWKLVVTDNVVEYKSARFVYD